MLPFKTRLAIFIVLWLLAGVAFALAPFAPTGYPEAQERFRAFLAAPLMVALGLAFSLPVAVSSSAAALTAFLAAVLYLVCHAAVTLGCRGRRTFLALCAVHVVQVAVAVVSFVRYTWQDTGG